DFSLAFFGTDVNVFLLVVFAEFSVYHKKFGAVPDVLFVDGIEISFSVGQMINTVQYIGFADAVFSYQAIDFGVKIKNLTFKVFIIDERELINVHDWYARFGSGFASQKYIKFIH